MRWSGISGDHVDIYIDGIFGKTITNGGQLSVSGSRWSGETHDFQICEYGGAVCSDPVTLSF